MHPDQVFMGEKATYSWSFSSFRRSIKTTSEGLCTSSERKVQLLLSPVIHKVRSFSSAPVQSNAIQCNSPAIKAYLCGAYHVQFMLTLSQRAVYLACWSFLRLHLVYYYIEGCFKWPACLMNVNGIGPNIKIAL